MSTLSMPFVEGACDRQRRFLGFISYRAICAVRDQVLQKIGHIFVLKVVALLGHVGIGHGGNLDDKVERRDVMVTSTPHLDIRPAAALSDKRGACIYPVANVKIDRERENDAVARSVAPCSDR